jgi:hypothetical protein
VADQFRRQQRQDRWLARTDAETDATPTLERIPDPAGFNLERIWDEEWEKNLVDVALERIKDRVNPGLYQMFDLYVVSQVDVLQVGRNDAAG